MALTKNDLSLIKDLLIENNKSIRVELHTALAQQSQDIKRNIRDEMDARFTAFEKKMNKNIDARFTVSEQKIRGKIADALHDNILPALERIEHIFLYEIARIHKHVGMAT